MPKFDVEVTFPARARTVIQTSADTMREAEIAAIALVDARPASSYSWEIIRPAKPKFRATAMRGQSNGTEVATITEETVMQNPAGDRLMWWAGFKGWLDSGPYSTRTEAVNAFKKKHGFDPPVVEQHEVKAAPKRRRAAGDGRRRKTLISSTKSKAAEKTIRSAATSQFGRGKTNLDFEHGQWFATVRTKAGDDLYSVVDTYAGGIGFELLESHEY